MRANAAPFSRSRAMYRIEMSTKPGQPCRAAEVLFVGRSSEKVPMELDPVLLSRLQFAWVIGWHILMPAFTVGLASYIALLEGIGLFTGREVYVRISMYWIRIFSVAFGVGVVSGVIMPFQFGTNWSRLSDTAGDVLG